MKSALQILLRAVIILAAAAVVSFAGQTLIHSTFGSSLTGMSSGGQGYQQGGAPSGEQASGQGDSAQPSADAASASADAASTSGGGQGMQRGGRSGGGHGGGGNAILEMGKNLAIVLIITAIGGLITTVAQRFLRRRGKHALAGASE